MPRNEVCETQDGETSLGDTPYANPRKAMHAYVVDVKTITASSSPTDDSASTLTTDEGTTTMAQKPSSPKTDFTIQPPEEREGSPAEMGLNLSHLLPSLPRENGGKMEIEIPLSVFHNWLRMYGSSVMMQRAKQLSTTAEEHSGQSYCSDTDVFPTNLSFRMDPQHQSSAAEDGSLKQRDLPSPTPTTQAPDDHQNMSQNPFTSYKPLPSGGILKNAASQDVSPFNQRDIDKSYSSKPPNYWDAYDKEVQAPPIQEKIDSNPFTDQQNAASKSYNEDTVQQVKEQSDMGPSAVLMMNSSSTSVLHLTNEEVMKLKKMISRSL